MQGSVLLRSLAVAALTALLPACHFKSQSAAGQTPEPSNTTLAQANSTAAPDQAMSNVPGEKFIAMTRPNLKGVTFAVWANGRPIGTISWPGKALDITQGMRGHANVLVIQWTRTSKNGTGTMTIQTAQHKPVLTAHVTPASPTKGQISKTLVAPQAPVGRP